MYLLNNKLFIIGLVLVLVVGLLAIVQLMDNSSLTEIVWGSTTEDPNDEIKKDVKNMSQSNWDNTVYYLIKKNIDDYHKLKLIDDNENKSLNDLLYNTYLLKLIATTEEFCEKSGDMNLWNELYTETAKFSTNPDMNKAIILLNEYRNIHTTALTAENYGKNEKYDASKSSNYQNILNGFKLKEHIKENQFLNNEVNTALTALGTVKGYENKFNSIELDTCNCTEEFKRNKYYKNECLK
jgi:hypothetical protein